MIDMYDDGYVYPAGTSVARSHWFDDTVNRLTRACVVHKTSIEKLGVSSPQALIWLIANAGEGMVEEAFAESDETGENPLAVLQRLLNMAERQMRRDEEWFDAFEDSERIEARFRCR
jgi:hypothetical protein